MNINFKGVVEKKYLDAGHNDVTIYMARVVDGDKVYIGSTRDAPLVVGEQYEFFAYVRRSIHKNVFFFRRLKSYSPIVT